MLQDMMSQAGSLAEFYYGLSQSQFKFVEYALP
jgi:hypothetical protein